MVRKAATSGPNTIRILITTDNHVGYNERDAIRGQDSWLTFHEIMTMAKNHDVDMVLQAGDLFHENKPSRSALYQVIRSLRMNCYGEKPCELEPLSDSSLALGGSFDHLNFEDPDINVAIPVMAISGNHDDATGQGLLAPMDILAAAGLLNHFGRVSENDNITLVPLLFQKGYTKLALYGMASVRDERLYRTFRDGKVKYLRPQMPEGHSQDEWFNLMAVHQNHHAHSETGYLPENFLQSFLDMVVWGHEHECLVDPVKNVETGFNVIQPGSSVATSLCEGEAKTKYVCILSITGKEFSIEKLRLKTVRPFVMKEISLVKDFGPLPSGNNAKSKVTTWMIHQVEALIEQARKEWQDTQKEENNSNSGHHEVSLDECPLPLIRLRVEYSGGYEVENPRRFSNRFIGKVANVNDVVQFYRKRQTNTQVRKTKASEKEAQAQDERLIIGALDDTKVQALVKEYLLNSQLEALPENGFGEAVNNFVDRNDRDALKIFVDESLELQFSKALALNTINIDEIKDSLRKGKLDIEKSIRNYGTKSLHVAASAVDSDGTVGNSTRSTPAAQLNSRRAVLGEDDDDDLGFDQSGGSPRNSYNTTPRSGQIQRDNTRATTGRSSRTRSARTTASRAATTQRDADGDEVLDSDEDEFQSHDDQDQDDEQENPRASRTTTTRARSRTRQQAAQASPPIRPTATARVRQPRNAPGSSSSSSQRPRATTPAAAARQSKLSFVRSSQQQENADTSRQRVVGRPERQSRPPEPPTVILSDEDDAFS